MNVVVVAIVLAIVLATRSTKESFLIGLNYILFCLTNSSQIAKKVFFGTPGITHKMTSW